MQQLTIFMDIESSRSYIDELYSSEPSKTLEALVTLKNSVIGSNRQKSSVIQQGIVPRLLQLMSDETLDPNIRLEATITIGSLAKGTAENVSSLVEQGAASALVELLRTVTLGTKLVEASLCALRSIFLHPPAPVSALPVDMRLLSRLTQIAREGSPTARACVVRILSIWCGGPVEQEALSAAGACGAAAALLASRTSPPPARALPALDLLAAMCFENTSVSQVALNTRHGDKTIPELLTFLVSRDKPLPVAMGAARCLTFMHRAGALPPDDNRVVFGALPCLARLCTKDMPEDIRATAAETLAYLAEVDTSLQRLAAISNHLMSSLADIVNCPSAAAKQGAFKCFASLGANDEDIRKRIIETHGLMVHVVNGMNNPEPTVRLAAVRCLHSLSRSVQQLRTTFQDHAVWKPLMQLLNDSPGTELLTVGSSTLCNLLLEFSPAKEPMLDQGAVEMLCNLTKRPEAALRLNGIWALMNMAFQAEQKVKQRILSCLGTEQMFRLLGDSDTRVIMKTLGLLRNLLSTRQHIDAIMSEYSSQVMQAVIVVLEGSYPAEVKEQALCILGNIGDGEKAKDLIMANEDVLRKLVDYLAHPESKLQEAALFVANNLVWRGEAGAAARQVRLAELGVLRALKLLYARQDAAHLHDKTTRKKLKDDDIENMLMRLEAGEISEDDAESDEDDLDFYPSRKDLQAVLEDKEVSDEEEVPETEECPDPPLVHEEIYQQASTSRSNVFPQINTRNLIWKKRSLEYKEESIAFLGSTELGPELMKLETPLQFFSQYFSEDLLKKIVEETNKYSTQTNIDRPVQISLTELRKYLGILIFMSVYRYPSVRSYWSSKFGFRPIIEAMPVNKFEKVRSILHFNDNNLHKPVGSPDHDKLHKLRPIIDHLTMKFSSVPMKQRLSVDEQMCATKISHFLKQYLPNKPHKWGFKLFALCSLAGYCYDFIIYSGTDKEPMRSNEPDIGVTGNTVIKLTRRVPRMMNHVIYFDNYYTSLPLMYYMAKEGIWCLGTVQLNRLGKSCKLPKKKEVMNSNVPRGSYVENTTSLDGVDFSAISWKDNKQVTLLSTYIGAEPVETIERYDKNQKKKVPIPCPKIIKEYNAHMGGVDLMDSFLGRYHIKVKSRKWYMRIFYHLLDLSVINSWILYKKVSAKKNLNPKQVLNLAEFRAELADALCKYGEHVVPSRGRPSRNFSEEPAPKRKNIQQVMPSRDVRYDGVDHIQSRQQNRMRCMNPGCKLLSSIMCLKCKVYLCSNKKTTDCFNDFHL